ncbi:class I SAM-dependent DNA methyltransferase [Micromonospora zhanjiangensis]|uniref:Class I SAM-dependent DNA methyltransferase n=1 Tax=Micromonospora zhanjiangensis TaxID=1522057 RepID=A0ABV8KIJ9_9ACTN
MSAGADAGDDRFYDSYVSTHAGTGGAAAAALVYRRDIRPYLPRRSASCRVLDIGCGQGKLVALMLADGLDAHGVDISPEQVAVAHARGLDRVQLGDLHRYLHETAGTWDAIVATDVLEHLTRRELIRTFDDVRAALRRGGRFIARVPNAVSPTGGHTMYGDFTHQTWFTHRRVAQLAAVTGFDSVRSRACPPPVHGLTSLVRSVVWGLIGGAWKLALMAETGQLRGHIVTQNLTFVAASGELAVSRPVTRAAVSVDSERQPA